MSNTKHKAVFLDRDDTLIEDPGYINHPSQVKLLPGAAAALSQLRKMGFQLVVVSNQSGVARGILNEETLAQVHHTLEKRLADEGAYLDAIYYCPFHPDGVVEKYRMESDMRKPAPGMLLKAAEELHIDLSQSWMVGDSYRDVEAGKRAGCKTILINNPAKPPLKHPADPEPDRQAVNIREAINIIRMFERTQHQPDMEKKMLNPRLAETEQPAPAPTLQPDHSNSDTRNPHVPPSGPKQQSHQDDSSTDSDTSPSGVQHNEAANPTHPVPHTTETLLHDVLSHLKMAYRLGQDEDFSVWMILAGACQILAIGCLVVAMWFFLDSTRSSDSVLVMLGFAGVIQLMTMTFFLMRGRQ